MAAEPVTESIGSFDPVPEALPAGASRSRRSILAAGLAGLAGLVFGSLGKPTPTEAAAGGAVIMGASNSAGTTNTTLSTNSTGTALYVTQNGTGTALRGIANDGIAGFFTSSNGSGVSGVVANSARYGVYGANDAAVNGTGAAIRANGEHNIGLLATTADPNSFAIKAVNTDAGTGPSGGRGIRALTGDGTDTALDSTGYSGAGEFCGPNGVVAFSTGGGFGVLSYSDTGYAVWGQSASHIGIYGYSGSSIGVYGETSSGYAIYSQGHASVAGNLDVTGAVSKASGSFKIDHPLDPAGKFLYHSFVESPDMKNVYDGEVLLDAKGEATVTLPDWFDALNRDTRIQLTAVGEFSPLYVSSEAKNGAFAIAGGKTGQKVYWQLTGIRRDAWANAHRIPIEEDKPAAERGLYLHPTEHGKPAADGIDVVRNASLKARSR